MPDHEQTTTPAPAEETPKLRIDSGWLVEEVDHCTCGAGNEYGHEPGCGLDPLMPVSELAAELAELARVLPVVDAARAWTTQLDEHEAAIKFMNPATRALFAAVAALAGDAAATPQPAAPVAGDLDTATAMTRVGEYLDAHQQQGDRGEDLIDEKVFDDNRGGWSGELYASDLRLILTACASSAPPVDVTARIRAAAHAAFTAMDKGVLMSETGDGAESVLAVGHLHLIAEYLERHPGWPSAQAIVRALANPTTEETTDAR
jgi:hypothetical protein